LAGGRGRGFGVDAVGFLDAGFGLVDDVVTQNGERTWYRYRDVVLDDSDFDRIGAALEAAGTPGVQQAQIDAATCRLPLRDAVDFARDWMIKNRERSSS
jgi:aminoglycoside N3'-acetyltransferase